MRRILFFLVLLLLSTSAHILAQDEKNIPACSEDQMAAIGTIFQGFSTDFAALHERRQSAADGADMRQLIVDLNEFQQKWWTETYPSLPACALALDLSGIAGRMIDESLITVGLAEAGYIPLARAHAQQVTVLSKEFNDMSQVAGISASATTPVSGAWSGGTRDGRFVINFRVTGDGKQLDSLGIRSGVELRVTPANFDIIDSSFSVELPGDPFSGMVAVVIVGTFVSPTELEGTLTVDGQRYEWKGAPK